MFDKLLELLSRSGSGILLPGSPGEFSGHSVDASSSSAPSGSDAFAGMPAEEWKSLLWEAHRQRVMGFVADAVAGLPYDEQPPLAIRAKLVLELEIIEKNNVAVNAAASELVAAFEAAGLHPVIQKGPAVSALYPNPLHRESGDIDFYFPAGEFERSRAFVDGLSSRSVTAPVMESDGAFWYKYNGVTIEHHPVFYDCRCQFPSIDVKSPEATLLMLSAHILKHALGKGIGLKQIVDYFVARRTLNYDPVLLDSLTAEAGLRKWQRLLDDFGPALRRIVAAEGNFGLISSSSAPYEPGASGHPVSLKLSRQMSRRPVSFALRLRTAAAFCRKIPFALRYSPSEWLHTVILLSRKSR